MVSIPQNLKGATVLEAHQWVVSTLDGFNEYVLKDNSGMDIAIVTSSQTDQEGQALLKTLGMPFREKATK